MNLVKISTRIYPEIEGGGPANYAYFSSKNSANKNLQIINIACFPNNLKGKIPKVEKISSNFEIRYLPFRSLRLNIKSLAYRMRFTIFFLFHTCISLLKIHRKKRINLIHAQYPTITGIPALIFKYIFRIPYVYTYHGVEYINRIESFIDLKLIHKYASKITVVSKSIQNYFYHIFKKRDTKIIFIPNGIECPKKPIHTFVIEEYNKIVSKINLTRVKTVFKIISYVGNMIFAQKVKGMMDFLKAFDEFLSEWENPEKNNIRLVFLGDGPLRSQLLKAISETKHRNQILLVGERLDVSNFLAVSILSALTSYREGFPLALLESMVAGVPSIASNTGEIKEIIGNTGYMVEPGDISEMKKALHSFFSDPEIQIELGKMCFDKVKAYNWRKIGKKTAKIYKNVYLNC